MRRRAAMAGSLAAIGLAAGCATQGGGAFPTLQQQRGAQLAERQCAACHAVSEETERMGAPSFLRIGRRYNALAFERRIKEIAEGRHGLMPPLRLTPEEAADLAAHIAALAVRPAPCDPPVESETCSR